MKKNQNGVSMVSLVITIIVIIILAAVAFSGSQETIGRAGFSGFTTDIDSVRTAFMTESIPNLLGEQTAANNSVSEVFFRNLCISHRVSFKSAFFNKLTCKISFRAFKCASCTFIFKRLFIFSSLI